MHPTLRRSLRAAALAVSAALPLAAVAVPANAVPANAGSVNAVPANAGSVNAVHSGGHHSQNRCVRVLPTGDSTVDVTYRGTSYPVAVHVPAASKRRELPLVLDLHGSNNNATLQATVSGLKSVSDEEGFIVANPQGTIAFPQTLPDGNWAWNVPDVPLTSGTYPPSDARDDVGFLTAVVRQIDARGCVDEDMVYATGYSGGGRMASALACEKSNVFAAIAPVAGLRAGRPDPADIDVPDASSCNPRHPVAVVTFHGTADQVNPYEGNADLRWGYPVQLAAETWADLNDCRVGPRTKAVSEHVTRYTWTRCDDRADVTLYEVAEGGHTWPGSDLDFESFGLGAVTQEIDASQIMWDFFRTHAKR